VSRGAPQGDDSRKSPLAVLRFSIEALRRTQKHTSLPRPRAPCLWSFLLSRHSRAGGNPEKEEENENKLKPHLFYKK